MSETLTPLTVDFLSWLAAAPRPYAEVMEAWRSSCPRLTIWEDALDAGLVRHRNLPGQPGVIAVTEKGARLLAACRDR